MTKEESAEVTRLIELATEVSKARQKELFRCVDILTERAEHAKRSFDYDAALAFCEAAKALLRG